MPQGVIFMAGEILSENFVVVVLNTPYGHIFAPSLVGYSGFNIVPYLPDHRIFCLIFKLHLKSHVVQRRAPSATQRIEINDNVARFQNEVGVNIVANVHPAIPRHVSLPAENNPAIRHDSTVQRRTAIVRVYVNRLPIELMAAHTARNGIRPTCHLGLPGSVNHGQCCRKNISLNTHHAHENQ